MESERIHKQFVDCAPKEVRFIGRHKPRDNGQRIHQRDGTDPNLDAAADDSSKTSANAGSWVPTERSTLQQRWHR
jgi:hypothetical protein